MAPGKNECVVRDVKLRNDQLGPVLVTFEHGCLKQEEASNLKCGVYFGNDGSNKRKVAAVANGGDVVYQGDVHEDEEDICRTFLAVRNKKTNKMRIYETSHAMLSPTVASNNMFYLDIEDKKQANYNLSHAFGSKKSKRVADQRARMEVNVDSVKEKLSTTVIDIAIKEDNIVAAEDDSLSKLLPPCNREASSPPDVYPISGMLKTKEIVSLENWYSKKVETEELDTSIMSSYYKYLSKRVAPGNVRNSALLLYAESLVNFCNLHPKQVSQRGTNFCPFSDLVHKRIIKDFTSTHGNNISRSSFMTDKAVMYIIILSLHVGGFQVDLDLIAECIKNMDINRIRMLARSIGTIPSKSQSASKNSVMLRVPLPPPQSLIVRGRKSRK